MRGRGGPFAAFVDPGEGLGGADHVVRGDFADFVRAVKKQAEAAADVAVSLGEQAGGVGVAVDGATAEAEAAGNGVDAFPVDEGVLDFLLVAGAADAATAAVTAEGRIVGAGG